MTTVCKDDLHHCLDAADKEAPGFVQALYWVLVEVQGGEHRHPRTGICAAAHEGMTLAEDFDTESAVLPDVMLELFFTWEKFSGNIIFPVPSADEGCEIAAYHTAQDHWEGEYGKLRLELLDHCINELGAYIAARG